MQAGRLGRRTRQFWASTPDGILADVLGLSSTEIGRLRDAGIVAGPKEAAALSG